MNNCFITLEQARVLRDLGFTGVSQSYYWKPNSAEDRWILQHAILLKNHNLSERKITAVYIQEAVDWIYERFGVAVSLIPDGSYHSGNNNQYWFFTVQNKQCHRDSVPGKELALKCALTEALVYSLTK